MSQFDVYLNTNTRTAGLYPLLVDVQNAVLDSLHSRLVVPLTLVEQNDGKYPTKLCPVILIQGKPYFLLTHLMTSVPIQLLSEFQCSIKEVRDEIVGAIDFAVTGI